jgi:hypothetical protein
MGTSFPFSTLLWRGHLPISKRVELDYATSNIEFEFTCGIWDQKHILIDALEAWLNKPGAFLCA